MTRPNISQCYFSKTLAGVWLTCLLLAGLATLPMGCENSKSIDFRPEDLNPSAQDANTTQSVSAFESLDLEQDPFRHSSTKDSQLAVIRTLFNETDGYRIPGVENYLPDKPDIAKVPK